MPKNLKPEDEPIFSWQNLRERFIEEPKIITLENVKINGDGFLFRGLWPMIESFSSGTLPGLPRLHRWIFFDYNYSLRKFLADPFLIRSHLTKKMMIEKPILWITDNWSTGYFHWLADAVPRLYSARQFLNEALIVLPAGYEKLNFVTATLDILKVKNIRYLQAGEVVVAKKLILPAHLASSGNYNPELMNELRQIFRRALNAKSAGSEEKIYISRSDSGKRKVGNEKEIIALLEKNGFRVAYPEKLSFQEQLALFSRAKCLISIHGAGLTNMLFMAAGAKVLEFKVNPGLNNCYFSLASALQIDYYYQRSAREIKKNGLCEIFIDQTELEKNLKLMGC